MKALVIGGDSFIGGRLAETLRANGHEVVVTTRVVGREDALFFDMKHPIGVPRADVVFICAAMTRFIDCEQHPEAYRVNVDAPVSIAKQVRDYGGKVVYFSSEAVEKALGTKYGLHKALVEMALAGLPNAIVVRIGKTDEVNVDSLCRRVLTLAVIGNTGLFRLCE